MNASEIQLDEFSRFFSERPEFVYPCPKCKKGQLVPDQSSFKVFEPAFSKEDHKLDAWEPEWISRRFSLVCVCNIESCGEVSIVSGLGTVDAWYDHQQHRSAYYSAFEIRSFNPAPPLIRVPVGTPEKVTKLLDKSFALYWVDLSAAANAIRASLEALLDEVGIPRTQKTSGDKTHTINLHRRLIIWSEQEQDYADFCMALKDVGNLGSHGEDVLDEHFFGVLQIYKYLLTQLYENDAAKMKALASKIRAEIKGES